MRSRSLKISNSPKDVTTLLSLHPENQSIMLYEGFFSFLSELAMKGNPKWFGRVVVLNSLSFLPQMMEFWHTSAFIYSSLDNDKAGDRATALLKSKFPLLQDKRDWYADYNDLNDFLCGKKKIKTIKEVING